MVWERYCYASPNPEFSFIFFVYIFIHISANMSPFGLKISQMILHTETSKLMYNWSFLFVVLHKPTLLSSTFKFLQISVKIISILFKTYSYVIKCSINSILLHKKLGLAFLSETCINTISRGQQTWLSYLWCFHWTAISGEALVSNMVTQKAKISNILVTTIKETNKIQNFQNQREIYFKKKILYQITTIIF